MYFYLRRRGSLKPSQGVSVAAELASFVLIRVSFMDAPDLALYAYFHSSRRSIRRVRTGVPLSAEGERDPRIPSCEISYFASILVFQSKYGVCSTTLTDIVMCH